MFALDNLESTNTRANKNADSVTDLRIDFEARLGDGFVRGGKSKVDEAPHLARFLLVYKVQRIEIFHLGGKGDGEPGCVEALNGGHAAGPCQELSPHLRSGS